MLVKCQCMRWYQIKESKEVAQQMKSEWFFSFITSNFSFQDSEGEN
jgi:hypothetical protein